MALSWGRATGDRIQGGVQFHCNEDHWPILACMSWACLMGFEESLAVRPGTRWGGVGLGKGHWGQNPIEFSFFKLPLSSIFKVSQIWPNNFLFC